MHPVANDSFRWWLERLPRYNLGLIIAGLSAFMAYLLIGTLLLPASAGFEVTFFSLLFQSIGYLILMVFANLCFLIGPVSESMLRPDDVASYRKKWHTLGCRLSFVLPFGAPLVLLLVAVLHG